MSEKAAGANLSVLVENLPEDVKLHQISKFCSKVGAIATHPETGEDLILLNSKNRRATVTYFYPEGANAAISILNNAEFVIGTRVLVSRAKREPFNFTKWKSAMKQERKYHSYLGTHEEELGSSEEKRLKVMILSNCFTKKEIIKDPELYGRIVQDWTKEGSKFGKVTLVKPLETNPNGVVIVRFDSTQSAALAIGEFDRAQYRGREIKAEPWDGSDLSVRETEEDEQERIKAFEEALDKALKTEEESHK